jgi:predicted TIM-barrel fold metal-dependent hydrolase
MHDAARLAGEFPDVQIMLNHAGMPIDQTADGRAAWRAGMDALAANSNVAVKLSGLVMIDWNWTTERLRPWILDSIAIFGADRCMFGSNFPVDKLHATYPDLLNAFRSIVADFSVTDRHALFHANAERLYRL